MLTKNTNFMKSIKTVKIKSIDFTGFCRLYKICKNYKKAIFHPAKVLCGVICIMGSNPIFSVFLLGFQTLYFLGVSPLFFKCSQNAHKIFCLLLLLLHLFLHHSLLPNKCHSSLRFVHVLLVVIYTL